MIGGWSKNRREFYLLIIFLFFLFPEDVKLPMCLLAGWSSRRWCRRDAGIAGFGQVGRRWTQRAGVGLQYWSMMCSSIDTSAQKCLRESLNTSLMSNSTQRVSVYFSIEQILIQHLPGLRDSFHSWGPSSEQKQPCLPGVCLLRNTLSLKNKLNKKNKTYYTFCLTSFEEKKKSLQCSLSCLCWNVNVTICLGEKAWKKQLG